MFEENKVALLLIVVTSAPLLVFQSVQMGQAQAQQALPRLYVTGVEPANSGGNGAGGMLSGAYLHVTPHEIMLRGIKNEDGSVTKNENFILDKASVAAIPIGQNINITSDSQLSPGFTITAAKLASSLQDQQEAQQGQTTRFNLNPILMNTSAPLPVNTNLFSLAGYPVGAYILDVILRSDSNNVQGAYETVLQILSQDELTKATTEKKTDDLMRSINTGNNNNNNNNAIPGAVADSQQCLFNPSLKQCKPDIAGNCQLGWSKNDDGQCFPSSMSCPPGYERADDDETGACVPISPSKAAQNAAGGTCTAIGILGPTYPDPESGCPVPCPAPDEVDEIPEGCPSTTSPEITTCDPEVQDCDGDESDGQQIPNVKPSEGGDESDGQQIPNVKPSEGPIEDDT